MAHILVVDDEKAIRDLIKMTLAVEEYTVSEADNGERAYELIQENSYDLILLDIMLPKLDGYQVLQNIRNQGVPVIFISAKVSLQDKILGLRLGADDYMTKPFEPMELLARIESLLRRTKKDSSPKDDQSIIYQDIVISVDERCVKKNNLEIDLTVKEFDLLLTFINHPNIVLSRETLLSKVWEYDYYGGTRTVDMHVKQIREKLGLRECLKTVYKVGYKLVKD